MAKKNTPRNAKPTTPKIRCVACKAPATDVNEEGLCTACQIEDTTEVVETPTPTPATQKTKAKGERKPREKSQRWVCINTARENKGVDAVEYALDIAAQFPEVHPGDKKWWANRINRAIKWAEKSGR